MNLSRRSNQQERMDTECADFDDYSRCLRDLSRVNAVTLTHRPMLSWLAKHAQPGFSLLDIACGHGDAFRSFLSGYAMASFTGASLMARAASATICDSVSFRNPAISGR